MLIILSLTLFIISPARVGAQDVQKPVAKPVDKLCRTYAQHVPEAGVRYKPGVDVRGREVTPADLDSGQAGIAVPEIVKFNITADVARRLVEKPEDSVSGATGPEPADLPEGLEMKAGIGEVAIDTETGSVYFNGVPVTERFKALCAP